MKLLRAVFFWSVIALFLPFSADGQTGKKSYYSSNKSNCINAQLPVYDAATGYSQNRTLYACNRESFYLAGPNGPNYAQELFVFTNSHLTGDQNSLVPILMQPGRSYAFNRNTPLAKTIEGMTVAVRDTPTTPWSAAKMTTPFLPTFWVRQNGGQGDASVTSLRTMDDWPYTGSPLSYNSRILIFGAESFRKHGAFVHRLSKWPAAAVKSRAYSHRHTLVVYKDAGDASGNAKMALVPYVPVADVRRQFTALTRETDVATFALGDAGILLRAMEPFYNAYVFYNASGMAEDDRQRCAKWRRNGAQPGLRPLHCF